MCVYICINMFIHTSYIHPRIYVFVCVREFIYVCICLCIINAPLAEHWVGTAVVIPLRSSKVCLIFINDIVY